MRGDLDWIVMKALEKDRTRRYETANGLAMDIQRHLQQRAGGGPPAQRRSIASRSWCGGNKLVFAAVGAVVAALVSGLGVAAWQFIEKGTACKRAVAAEKQAKTEANKSRQVAQFLKDMLKGADPSVALGRDATMLREILDKTAERVGKELKEEPEVEAELRNMIGTTYYELGEWAKAEDNASRGAAGLEAGVVWCYERARGCLTEQLGQRALGAGKEI